MNQIKENVQVFFSRVNKIEKYVFYFIIAINLIPIFSVPFFTNLDGAAHLYNAQLIKSMVLDSTSPLHDYFLLNSEAVPNWFGHFLLAFLELFVQAMTAEKIMLCLYLIFLPLSFRAFIKSINQNGHLLFTYFIFPLCYTAILFHGFYNFCFALIFLFYGLTFWNKNEGNLLSKFNLPKLALILILTYFSHLFIFALLLLTIISLVSYQSFYLLVEQENHRKVMFKKQLLKISYVLLAGSLPAALSVFYFVSRPSFDNNVFIPFGELVESLLTFRSLTGYSYTAEAMCNERIASVFIALIAVIFSLGIYRFFRKGLAVETTKTGFSKFLLYLILPTRFWLYFLLALFVAIFIFPDSGGTVSLFSMRIILLFYFFLICWMTTKKVPAWFTFVCVVVVLLSNFKLNKYYKEQLNILNEYAVECANLSKKIPANSVVLPLNYSNNWIQSHNSNYLGIDKPMIILENYEADMDYFPIQWNLNRMAATKFANLGDQNPFETNCVLLKSVRMNPKIKVDYIFILGDPKNTSESCSEELQLVIQTEYKSVYQSNHCSLYKRK